MRTSQTSRRGASLAACVVAATGLILPAAHAAESDGIKKKLLVIQTQHHEDVSSLVAKRTFNDFAIALALDPEVEAVVAEGLKEVVEVAVVETAAIHPTIDKADVALATGKDHEANKAWGPATVAFKEAMDSYEQEMAHLENFDKYVDAMLSRALAYYQLKLDDNGEDELNKVLILRPTTVVDKRTAPQEAVAALKRLRGLYANSKTGAQAVLVKDAKDPQATPPAVVFLDGNLVGDAPVRLEHMLPGRHWVRVVAEGYHPWVEAIDAGPAGGVVSAELVPKVVANKTPEVPAATPEELRAAARTGAFGASFDAKARSTCDKYGLDGLVLTYMRSNGASYELAGFYFDKAEGKLAELPWAKMDIELTTMKVAVQELSREVVAAATRRLPGDRVITDSSDIYAPSTVEGAGVVDLRRSVSDPAGATTSEPPGGGVAPPGGAGHEVEDTAIYEQWWFWTIVTVGLAGGATATYFALQEDAEATGFRTTVSF